MKKQYIQNKKMVQSKIGEEVVMMDMESGFYFGMNSVGSIIWQYLAEEISFDELVGKLMNEFNIDQKTCETDTLGFLNDLLEKNIIKITECE
jgi:hypothetical protein